MKTNFVKWLPIHQYPGDIFVWRLKRIGLRCILKLKLQESSITSKKVGICLCEIKHTSVFLQIMMAIGRNKIEKIHVPQLE